MKTSTPKQYYAKKLSNSRTYYSMFSNFNSARFYFLDHILNVIGNGIENFNEFLNEIKLDRKKYDFDKQVALFEEKIYNGYYTVDYFSEDENKVVTSSKIPENADYSPSFDKAVCSVFDSERKQYSTIIVWKENENRREDFKPYPNFNKQHTVLYKIDFSKLDYKDLWIKEFIYFYEECIRYFKSEKSNRHIYAFPTGNSNRDKYIITEYKKTFKRYDSNESISDAFGIQYNGDVEKFATDRWNIIKQEWIIFCQDAIEYLKAQYIIVLFKI